MTMGIFQRLFGQINKNAQHTVQEKSLDERKAECPTCQGTLKKIPGSKTKCPHCGQFVYVRIRPNDQVRVIVTEADAHKIDEEWAIVNGTHEQFIAEKKAIEDERDVLRKRFGKEPPENDVKWAIFLKQKLQHARAGNWGHYRNTLFQMAELLRKEGRLKGALAKYLEVCYLDLNGPENRGGTPPELLTEYPPFDPKHAMLAPGIVQRVKITATKLRLHETDIKQLFLEHGKKTRDNLKLPVSPNNCWHKLEEKLR